MEKQPNSRMCFVCGIENPIGLTLAFYTDDEGRCITHFGPRPEHQGCPGQLRRGVISTRRWMNQLACEAIGQATVYAACVTQRRLHMRKTEGCRQGEPPTDPDELWIWRVCPNQTSVL